MLTLVAVMLLNVALLETPATAGQGSAAQFVAPSRVDPRGARELADTVVQSVIRDRYSALYGRMERVFRDGVPEAEVKPMLERLYQAYGKPLEAEYKMQDEGYRIYQDGSRKPMQKVWYAIRTQKHAKGKWFLFVEVVPDEKALACASFMIVTFPGGPPSHLQ